MQIRCPHCHNSIGLVDDAELDEVLCPSCGSSFNLIGGDVTESYRAQRKTLAHFELIEQVGVGQFGSVWKARDTKLDRVVAVKIPRRGELDADEAELFLREARAVAQLKHPNIVSVHEVGREGDQLYIVSDFVDGANLKEWLSSKRLTPREAAELCATIGDALHHAHEAGVVHRDLKPGNIMMDAEGVPHIMDFGLAKRDAGEITMTMEGKVLGTPAYMPPEQALGRAHEADRRSDVYSLGVILFELLTGELPFRGDKRMLLVQIINDDPPSPRKLDSRIPRDIETICLKSLEKEPHNRYRTIQEIADDLRRFIDGDPIQARPISAVAKMTKWCRKRPYVAGLTVALVFVVGIAITILWFQRQAAIAANQRSQQFLASYRKSISQSAAARHYFDKTGLEGPLTCELAEITTIDPRGSQSFLHEAVCLGPVLGLDLLPNGTFFLATFSADKVTGWIGNPDKQSLGGYYWPSLSGQQHILGMAYVADKRCVVIQRNGLMRLFAEVTMWAEDIERNNVPEVVSDLKERLTSVGFSWDRTLYAVGTGQGRIHVINGETLRVDETLQADGVVLATTIDDNSIVSAHGLLGPRSRVRLWDRSSHTSVELQSDHLGPITVLAIGPKGLRIAIGGYDRVVRVFNVANGDQVAALKGHSDWITAIGFDPSGSMLAAGCGDGSIIIWDLAKKRMINNSLTGHASMITNIRFLTADDRVMLVTSSLDHTVRVWNPKQQLQSEFWGVGPQL